jgi:hypothetical protein
MATAKVTPLSSRLQSATITSEQIGRYVKITSQTAELEWKKDALRSELLTLHAAGAEQATRSPYLLNFVLSERRTVDWKEQSLALAQKLYGLEEAANWKARIEQTAPCLSITQIRVKPNPLFAGKLKMQKASTALNEMTSPIVIQ